VKGWILDIFRTVWALFYWNLRKTTYALSVRRSGAGAGISGPAPCQDASDSGEGMKTGCEACRTWARRSRFQRVCPLLTQTAEGYWLCGVDATKVRPFWGRAFGYFGGSVVTMLILAVAVLYGTMHGIGYDVSIRQLVWPLAWRELRGVRAELFIKQARESYKAGEIQQAIQALVVAYQLNPTDLKTAMTLAQFYQISRPSQADVLYQNVLIQHPEAGDEASQVWFHSLLARGRLDVIAELAQQRLAANTPQAPTWSYALIFAARMMPEKVDLAALADDTAIPIAPRGVFYLASRVEQRAKFSAEAARKELLEAAPVAGFPLDRIYRVEALLRLGFAEDALQLMSQWKDDFSGRDMGRLLLRAYSVMGEHEQLRAEFRAMLAPTRELRSPELTMMAVHLVHFPDASLTRLLVEALPRLKSTEDDSGQWLEAVNAVFCAAGVNGDKEGMASVRQLLVDTYGVSGTILEILALFFQGDSEIMQIGTILPHLRPLVTDLNYALLERYGVPRSEQFEVEDPALAPSRASGGPPPASTD